MTQYPYSRSVTKVPNQNPAKFLLFVDAADDAVMYPIHSLIGIRATADSTVVLNFQNELGPNATEDTRDSVVLTITADTERAVMIAIAEAIGGFTAGGTADSVYSNVIEVCNDVTSTFLHANILSCVTTPNA